MTKNYPHWSEVEFAEEDICNRAYEKAAKHRTPQVAWDAWDEPGEMLWCLEKRGYYSSSLVRCGLDIVTPVNTILKRSLPKMKRFLLVQKKIGFWAKNPSEDRIREIASFMPDMKIMLKQRRIPYNAARAVYILARSVFRPLYIINLALEAGFALYYARNRFEKPLIHGIDNAELTMERIGRYHCDIVRRHFPNAPVIHGDD